VWVLKLGGSLLASGHLRAWIDWLAARAAHPVPLLVVPGGGPFADAVRALQPLCRASDRTAHRQALLAMQQYGWLLLEGLPAARGWRAGSGRPGPGLSVWLPEADWQGDQNCPEDWRTTADALALELALGLGADGLACVKSCSPLEGRAAAACFDGVCLELASRFPLPVTWLGPREQALAGRWLAGLPLPGTHRLAGGEAGERPR
jgi:aspartokinase-like uncharacterized kinase